MPCTEFGILSIEYHINQTIVNMLVIISIMMYDEVQRNIMKGISAQKKVCVCVNVLLMFDCYWPAFVVSRSPLDYMKKIPAMNFILKSLIIHQVFLQ